MKFSVATGVVAASLITFASAFVQTPAYVGNKCSSSAIFAVELEPEPEGGEEMSLVGVSLDGSRMKNMGVNDDFKSDDGSQVYNFWMTATAKGETIKKFRTEILKQSAKKANFPGFRKGQIPPYAQPQITGFALQESIINTCETAVAAYGLKALSGSDGSVDVKENVQEVCKTYKVGDDLTFTGTFAATFDPEKIPEDSDEESSEDSVVDAEVVEADA